MKFKIKKDELLKGLRRIQGVVGKTNTMPILSNILLIAEADGLEITATDLEVGIRARYQAEVETPGSTTVSAKKMYEVCRELPGDDVLVKVNDSDRVTITAGNAQFKLLGFPKDEYPQWPEVQEGQTISIDTGLLGEMIRKTIYASGDNDARYVLNGVLFHIAPVADGLAFKMVATDGHRLSLIGRMVNSNHTEVKVIVPKRAMGELLRLLDEDETASEARLGFTSSHILLKKNGLVMQSKLIDGEYPNYTQVIPQQSSIKVTIPRNALIGVLKRMSLMSNEKTKLVKIVIEEGKAVFSTTNAELGEASEEVALDYRGDRLTIGYNSRFLMDVLTAMGRDTVELGLNDPLSPCLVTEEGDKNHRGVVMPMRV